MPVSANQSVVIVVFRWELGCIPLVVVGSIYFVVHSCFWWLIGPPGLVKKQKFGLVYSCKLIVPT